jgi:pimeloyl-ACP methyl ester carboxylesterase
VRPQLPQTGYAKSGDVSIAYQVTGDGPFDLVFIPPYLTHAELIWTTSFAPTLREWSSTCRLIRFDKRGTGMSDRVSGAPTLEQRMDDARAVMDAVGSTRAAFFGSSEGAAMAILFAATYPERTAALVLRSAYPRTMWARDYPWGRTDDELARELESDLGLFRSREEALAAIHARGLEFADDDEAQNWIDYFRWSGSPGAVEALALMNKEIDVRHVLPAIRVPTLVLHGTRDTIVPVDVARYIADRIPSARLVEVDAGHLATGKASLAMQEEIESFLTEIWEAGGWDEAEPDRVLATVLFTDIVSATERQRNSATAVGATSCSATTASCVASSCARAARRWTRPATASSPPSTVRQGRSAALARSWKRSASSGSRSGRGSTPANASSSTARSPASPCTRAPASHRMRSRARCSSRRRSRTWSQVRDFPSRRAARTS